MCTYVMCVRVGVCMHMRVCAPGCVCVCRAGWGGYSKQRKPNVQLLGGEGPVSEATKAGRPGWRAATGRWDGCRPQTRPLNAQVCSLLSAPDGRPLPGLWGTDVRLTLPLTFASLAPTQTLLWASVTKLLKSQLWKQLAFHLRQLLNSWIRVRIHFHFCSQSGSSSRPHLFLVYT